MVTHIFLLDKLTLLAATLFLSVMAGVGLYQNLVAMPGWFANPPASFARINQNGKREIFFWIPIQILTLLSLVAAIVASWNEPRRNLIFLCLGCYLLGAVMTAAYLGPRIISWGKMDTNGAPSPELAKSGKRWLSLSWLRQAAMLTGEFALLIALAS